MRDELSFPLAIVISSTLSLPVASFCCRASTNFSPEGMEVASALIGTASQVTVVTMDAVPFQLQLGERVGKFLRQWHESKGVRSVHVRMNMIVSTHEIRSYGRVALSHERASERTNERMKERGSECTIYVQMGALSFTMGV